MIPVRKLRDLILEAPEGDEHSKHVAAASALVHLGKTLFLATDDERQLSIFEDEARLPGTKVQILEGSAPRDDEDRKKDKPDLESLAMLPSTGRFPDGAILALPSGTKSRDHGAVVRLTAGGRIEEARQLDLGPLYEGLRAEIDGFNIEGAAVRDGMLHIFQRGNEEDAINARIDLSLDGFMEALDSDRDPSTDLIVGITPYDLGRIRGVKLCFSDASPLLDGRLVFVCSAETTGSSDDGQVLGSALGVMGQDGDVERIQPVDLEVKIEGMTAMHDSDDGVRVLLVTDGDQPDQPSPLLEAFIPLG